MVFSTDSADIQGAITMAVQTLQDWVHAAGHRDNHGSTHMGTSASSTGGWKASGDGVMKVNVDAGWTGNGGLGFAMVVRDHAGNCLYAETSFIEHRLESTFAEATTLRWALARVQELELDTVEVETNALNVVVAFNKEKSFVDLEPVIKDCRMLAAHLHSFKLQHVRREANKVAHILASLAVDYPNRCWWDDFPAQIQSVLLAYVFSILI